MMDLNSIYKTNLKDSEFAKLSDFIYSNFGIKMPPAKRIMLQSRLHKRLRALNMNNFPDYLDYVFSKKGQQEEVVHMIDVVSTNKTDFFREPAHFDFLHEHILPEMIQQNKKHIKIWSAGCSSGEEPYTLAISLTEFAKKHSSIDFSIHATDISTVVLNTAVGAVYTEARIANLPFEIKKKYFLKSKDRINPMVKVVPELRKKITFQRLNFMDTSYNVSDGFDVVFCRNVLIYFDKDTQEQVITKQCGKLKKDGYYFLGHSESTTGINVPLRQIKPTIFQKI